jgi:hypothetical protein
MSSEDNNVLNEEISQLRNENERLRNMCSVMEQMSVLLIPIVNECKCNHNFNSIKIKTKLNVLKLKYDSLKSNQNSVIHSFVNKINNCCNSTEKIVITKIVDNFDFNEFIDENNCHLNKEQSIDLSKGKSSRPQTQKRTKTCDKNEIINNSSENVIEIKEEIIDEHYNQTETIVVKTDLENRETDNNLVENSNLRPNGKKRRKKKFVCVWPGCEHSFRDGADLKNHMWKHTGIYLFSFLFRFSNFYLYF